ncbi:T9SS type A sorting domain-containing protein [Dyadobacter sp. CY345]|uniref:sialate O-acetylesterase n=1 Tax=Dyadobacter sp. CY345 TaxID=2909335 RepID=UPI001F312162|nr:sialate O-acetylesterase [Dyadobacter sp. CY345]MCF2447764.1 T9SS type A sorting domain-containing protein [Dyadobacter sp. CY345]
MKYTVKTLLSTSGKYPFSTFIKVCLLVLFIPFGLYAQINLTAPLDRAVYQREKSNYADVTISGSYSIVVDKIEVQATPIGNNQGRPISWTLLHDRPTGGAFSGTLRLEGGWYKIEVRGIRGGVMVGNIGTIEHLGVGEVFIIAGQSNAQGMDYSSPVANDDRVNYVSYNNEIGNGLGDLPTPTFSRMNNANITMGLRGHGTWCWGILGDLLTQKLNVPVMFVNTGWDGTSIRNWWQSAQGIPTSSVYSNPQLPYPTLMPYANLRLSAQHYAKQYGVRAILWMQGETDNSPLNMSFGEYKNSLQSLIGKLSSDINRQVPWVIARTSYVDYRSNPTIVSAQNSVISDLPGIAFAGPETDNLPVQRIDGTHFYGAVQLNTLANAWGESLSLNFFSTANPVPVTQEPRITSTCATDNSSLNLSLPEGYLNYEWSLSVNGNTQYRGARSITVSSPGTYTGKVKDGNGNTLRTQTMVVNTTVKPAKPTIREIGSQQACADSSFTFSINGGNDIYNWYRQGVGNSLVTGTALTVNEGGDYFVRSENAFGCLSDNSDVSTLLYRPQVPTPLVEKIGPFTALASINQSGLNEKYDWRRDEQLLTTSVTNELRTTQTGLYSARANVTYVLGSNLLTCYSLYSNQLQVITEGESDIVVFPNPGARDNVFVESRDDIANAEIIVYDMYGRVVVTQTQDMRSRVKILVRNLPSGKYIVRIRGGSVDVTKQLVVL